MASGGAASGSRSRGVTGNGHFLDFSGLVGYICAIWNLRQERRTTRPLETKDLSESTIIDPRSS